MPCPEHRCAETSSSGVSDDWVGAVEQVTRRVAVAVGTCDFAITERDRRHLIRPPTSTEL